MRDPMPILAKLGADLQAERAGQLLRRTGRAEIKAIVMLALLSESPGQDFAAVLGVPEDVLETWWNEARQMMTESTTTPTSDKGPRALGIVA